MYCEIGFEIKQCTQLKQINWFEYVTDSGHTCMKNKY